MVKVKNNLRKYYLNGEKHREDGPVYQFWYENGQKQSEVYYLNGKIHREDGPANQIWYDNGQKELESYYLNNLLHREDGPAYQKWFENGKQQFDYYYLNGDIYDREDWINQLKEIGSPHYEDESIKYNSEKYNL